MTFRSARSRALVSSLLVGTLVSGFAPRAFAAAGDPVPAPAPAPVVDEVRLNDGSMVRGIIVEKTAAGDVALQLGSGETRRFKKAEIAYAGPLGGGASATPSPASVPSSAAPHAEPAAAAQDNAGDVHFEASVPEVRIHIMQARTDLRFANAPEAGVVATGESYRSLCIAPCDARVPVGRQQLALATDATPATAPEASPTPSTMPEM